jgi:ADP-ribose pyrophosphatase YjhB (NUDIX family)
LEITLEEREVRKNQDRMLLDHDKRVVAAYLKYGSVDEVLRRQDELNLYLSQAGMHRLLNKWGVVKAAGPNTKLSEAVYFLERLAEEKIPLERLYRKMPPSFQTSTMTLHRILNHIKEGVIRRAATALIITREGDNRILIGKDISTPHEQYGKFYGAFSVPMGFSKRNEVSRDSVLRVLQQEVFSNQVVAQNFPYNLVNRSLKPIIHFDVLDIRLSVYHVELDNELGNIENVNSFKLTDFSYMDVNEIFTTKDFFRAGVPEICGVFSKQKALETGLNNDVSVIMSDLNLALSDAN